MSKLTIVSYDHDLALKISKKKKSCIAINENAQLEVGNAQSSFWSCVGVDVFKKNAWFIPGSHVQTSKTHGRKVGHASVSQISSFRKITHGLGIGLYFDLTVMRFGWVLI